MKLSISPRVRGRERRGSLSRSLSLVPGPGILCVGSDDVPRGGRRRRETRSSVLRGQARLRILAAVAAAGG